ncbi:ATP synthase F1 subunit gamma [Candidatus Kaiserbacteria bacterium]|nr:MAG: ATP synthase F1 subunit gamma [Candidatus Kaiserbacteria bacterium]
MASLKQLKLKRISVNKTRQVTKAMESVSAVKMRKAQESALGGRAYAAGALRILKNLSGTIDVANHYMVKPRTKGKYGIIIITSDKGLAGSLNSAVLKKVTSFLKDEKYSYEKVLICIGRRGYEFATNRNLNVLIHEENKKGDVKESDMKVVTDMIAKLHKEGDTRAWYIAYTNFKSTFEQEAVIRRILPLSDGALNEVIETIIPDSGKYSDTEHGRKSASSYTVEPSTEAVLETIIPSLVNIVVYHALLETKASEHSARMVAMKSATDKATEMSQELLLKFNKARQAVITSEVSEITSGIEAMK